MNQYTVTYQGELRCELIHQQSGSAMTTDAPLDNHGKGESFSPTDLLAVSLGACMLTVMGIAARPLNVDLRGATCAVTKRMSTDLPRRVAGIDATLSLPADVDPDARAKLEQAGLNCPVHHSLHPDLQLNVRFAWTVLPNLA